MNGSIEFHSGHGDRASASPGGCSHRCSTCSIDPGTAYRSCWKWRNNVGIQMTAAIAARKEAERLYGFHKNHGRTMK